MLSVCLGLSACLGQTAAPEDHYYRLPVPHGLTGNSAPISNGEITVGKFRAEGVYRERAILYSPSEQPLELMHYHYSHWILPPETLLQDHFIDYLRNGDYAPQVTRYEDKQNPLFIIHGNIIRFERVMSEHRAHAVVALEFKINRSDLPDWYNTKVYRSTIEAADKSFNATIEAFGYALNEIYALLAQDLHQHNN
jgi:ABC-type uncharacterized transport system auxiliary subunit